MSKIWSHTVCKRYQQTAFVITNTGKLTLDFQANGNYWTKNISRKRAKIMCRSRGKGGGRQWVGTPPLKKSQKAIGYLRNAGMDPLQEGFNCFSSKVCTALCDEIN